MKRNNKKKQKRITIKIIYVTLIILSISATLKYINKKISPKAIKYAELEIRKLSGLIITQSVSTESLEKLNINDMFIITRNNNNEILTVDFNTVILNKVLIDSTIKIQENLKKLEQGKINSNNIENKKGVVLKIPSGAIYNNFLLNNIGPNIPVKLKILGDIQSKINTKVTNYGINNALIEVTLDITIKEEVLLPISTSEIKVTTTIPIAIKLIQGTVPNYYSGEINKSSVFSIPLE